MYERIISQLAHVELISPRPEETVDFFKRLFGLQETASDGTSTYLRCWGDYFTYSVQVTEGPQPALGHVGWRAAGPEQLTLGVGRLESAGVGEGWSEDQHRHGPAYRYRGPGGHLQELFWEVERYQAPPELRSPFPARPSIHFSHGVAPRQVDHVTVATKDPYGDSLWYRDTLGYVFTEYTALSEDHPDVIVFATITTNEKAHDLGLVGDFTDLPGRLHHLAFWVDSVEDLLRGADLLMDQGIHMEFGPGRHGMGEQTYLYFREPASGIRLEVNSGGYRIYQPDWEPVKWVPSQGSNTMYRNVNMPDSMMESFPPATAAEPALVGQANPWATGAAH